MSTCPVCELHAESTFKIEGMDCHEEVAILEQRLKRLAGLEALDADVMGQRLRIKRSDGKLIIHQIKLCGGLNCVSSDRFKFFQAGIDVAVAKTCRFHFADLHTLIEDGITLINF